MLACSIVAYVAYVVCSLMYGCSSKQVVRCFLLPPGDATVALTWAWSLDPWGLCGQPASHWTIQEPLRVAKLPSSARKPASNAYNRSSLQLP